MTNGKMDAIQVDDAVMGEQGTPAPSFLLLGQRLVQTTDSTLIEEVIDAFHRKC